MSANVLSGNRSGRKIKVAHIITDLGVGGAEVMLCKLLSQMDKEQFESMVISLSDSGSIGEDISRMGISVKTADMRRLADAPLALWRISRMLKEFDPDVVQTWLYHADLIGGIAARLAGNYPVIWNIRSLMKDPSRVKKSTLLVRKLCAFLSRWIPNRIIANSEAALRLHQSVGYFGDNMVCVPNGFDTDKFKPDLDARLTVRKELGLLADTRLVGLAARFDPNKDHESFVRSAGLISEQVNDVHFVLFGSGIDKDNKELCGWIEKIRMSSHFHLLGIRNDATRLMAALDISVLCSRSESFPNVVGEAMSCAIPCVVTDVGDSARIVGDTGIVVPSGKPAELAKACLQLLSMTSNDRIALGERARIRICENFSLDTVVSMYESIYASYDNSIERNAVEGCFQGR